MANESNKYIKPITWDELRENGLLWWINRAMHIFGIAIVVDVDDEGKAINAYPARVRFRGFSSDIEENGFIKVSDYIKSVAHLLPIEARDEPDEQPQQEEE